jgi:hypothetical protein
MHRAVLPAAVVGLTIVFGGATGAQASGPGSLWSSTSPQRESKDSHEYETHGKLDDDDGRKCPRGNGKGDSDKRKKGGGRDDYCEKPPKPKRCEGEIRIDYFQNGKLIRSKKDKLDDKCEYHVKTIFGKGEVRSGSLVVVARFLGNSVFDRDDASPDTVRVR